MLAMMGAVGLRALYDFMAPLRIGLMLVFTGILNITHQVCAALVDVRSQTCILAYAPRTNDPGGKLGHWLCPPMATCGNPSISV